MAHFDRAIPPGGKGKVNLSLNLTGYQGQVWKSATVISNDPQKPSITLNLHVQIRSHIEVRPFPFIQFKGSAERQEEKTIDLVTTSRPFQILKVESTLGEKIVYHLETIVKGRHYQLKVINRPKTGRYFGTIKCLTDHSKKPEIQISISCCLDG